MGNGLASRALLDGGNLYVYDSWQWTFNLKLFFPGHESHTARESKPAR